MNDVAGWLDPKSVRDLAGPELKTKLTFPIGKGRWARFFGSRLER